MAEGDRNTTQTNLKLQFPKMADGSKMLIIESSKGKAPYILTQAQAIEMANLILEEMEK